MIITLEGPDGGGKSTLARLLATEHEKTHGRDSTSIWHEGPPPEGVDLVAHYELPLLVNSSRLLDPSHLTVLDRWETGELVYGPLLRDHSGLSPGQALHVELLLRSLGARRVLVNPGMFWLDKRYDERGDELVEREWLPQIHDFYARYARRHHWLTVSTVDESTVSELYAYCEHLDGRVLDLAGFPGYVGHAKPDVLLVGERRSNWPAYPGDGTSAWGWGAFTPTGEGGSSRWLLDCLEELPELPALGICNAHERYQDLRDLWAKLGCPPVVALGREAEAELGRLDVEHVAIPHPQWARRFRRRYPAEYVETLERGIESALGRRENRRRGVLEPAPAGDGPRPAGESEDAAG